MSLFYFKTCLAFEEQIKLLLIYKNTVNKSEKFPRVQMKDAQFQASAYRINVVNFLFHFTWLFFFCSYPLESQVL